MSTMSQRAGKTMIALAAGACGLLALAYPDWRSEVRAQDYQADCGPNITNPLEALVGEWTFSSRTFDARDPFVSAGRFEASMGTQGAREGFLAVTQTSNDNGEIISQETQTGTFEVFEDCSGGTLTFDSARGPIDLAFVFADNRNEIIGVSRIGLFSGLRNRASCIERCNRQDDACVDDTQCVREYIRCVNTCNFGISVFGSLFGLP